MIIRMAKPCEKNALCDLWQNTFDDTQGFIRFFFEERYISDFCAVSEEDGLIVSCVHGLPCHILLRGHILPAVVIAGVSTRDGYGGKGYMRRTMQYFMETMRERGVALVAHRPQNLPTFFKLGHFPVSDTAYLELGEGIGGGVENTALGGDVSALYTCYDAFSRRYSGMVRRSYADFVLKCHDYLSCDARCVAVEDEKGICGYAIYFETDEEIIGEECLALSGGAYERLFEKMRRVTADKKITLRLAGDALSPVEGLTVLPRSVMGVSDIQAVLKAVGVAGFVLEITDGTVEENNGVFDSLGNWTDKKPQIRTEAGRLLQWAVGYRTMHEMAQSGEIEVLDQTAVEGLDAIGKAPCFIFDEY